MGALDESPELAASMEDDIIVSNVMNEARLLLIIAPSQAALTLI